MCLQFPEKTIEDNKQKIKDNYKLSKVFQNGLNFKQWIQLKIEERAEREKAENKNKDKDNLNE